MCPQYVAERRGNRVWGPAFNGHRRALTKLSGGSRLLNFSKSVLGNSLVQTKRSVLELGS